MKVVFLDVDGVLNRTGTKERINGFRGIDKELLTRFLQWKAKYPDVKIVLSSTWRTDSVFTNTLREALATQGVEWIDVTPNHHGVSNRGTEIFDWLSSNGKVTHFAILDDMGDMHPVGKNLVQTSEKFGLQDKHLAKVEKLLDLSL